MYFNVGIFMQGGDKVSTIQLSRLRRNQCSVYLLEDNKKNVTNSSNVSQRKL